MSTETGGSLKCPYDRAPFELSRAAAHPVDLADTLGISRTRLSNHLACLRGYGLVVAVPVGRRLRYELADPRLADALRSLESVVLAADPEAACIPPGQG